MGKVKEKSDEVEKEKVKSLSLTRPNDHVTNTKAFNETLPFCRARNLNTM